MKEKILTFLKSKMTGIPENYLSGIADLYSKTITDEKAIETTLTDHVLEVIKLSATQLQVEGDRRATEAQKTALTNYMKKHGLDENGKPIKPEKEKPTTDTTPDDAPGWFKTYQEKVERDTKELKTKLDNFELEKQRANLHSKTMSKLKEKGIPELFIKVVERNLKVDSEDKIDQLVSEIEGDFNTYKQGMAEQGVVISKPIKPDGGIPEGATIGKEIAEKRNTSASEGVKGKIKT